MLRSLITLRGHVASGAAGNAYRCGSFEPAGEVLCSVHHEAVGAIWENNDGEGDGACLVKKHVSVYPGWSSGCQRRCERCCCSSSPPVPFGGLFFFFAQGCMMTAFLRALSCECSDT
jgi:hypothetical protein